MHDIACTYAKIHEYLGAIFISMLNCTDHNLCNWCVLSALFWLSGQWQTPKLEASKYVQLFLDLQLPWLAMVLATNQ